MAGFQTKTFSKHDDYMTPLSAWKAIESFIPKDKLIWDPFFGDGSSAEHFEALGINPEKIHHKDEDFFTSDPGTYSVDLIVTNPPFSQIPAILKRMKEMGFPFIMIMPSSKICTQYFRRTFAKDEDPIQIIIPRKRIQFEKKLWCENCEEYHDDPSDKKSCNFDCFYYCWKMNLERDIIWLE
tara:strand:+ start:503 stop:1048 length:546 start_codon:yes stop_codon:yes gene_type:complete